MVHPPFPSLLPLLITSLVCHGLASHDDLVLTSEVDPESESCAALLQMKRASSTKMVETEEVDSTTATPRRCSPLLTSSNSDYPHGGGLGAYFNYMASLKPLWNMFNCWASDSAERALDFVDNMQNKLAPGSRPIAAGGSGRAPPMSAYDPHCRCPAASYEERVEAAGSIGGRLLTFLQVHSTLRAWLWSDGEDRPINPANDHILHTTGITGLTGTGLTTWADIADTLTMLALLPSLAMMDGGRTAWFTKVAKLNCWEPAPLVNGYMTFKYDVVEPRLTNREQERGFYACTSHMSDNFFSRSTLIFQHGPRHVDMRRLMEFVGFARRYPIDLSLIRNIPLADATLPTPDAAVITEAVFPTLMASIMGATPPDSLDPARVDYGNSGKLSIFGKLIDDFALGPLGVTQKLINARRAIAEWAKTTPFARVLRSGADEHAPGNTFFQDKDLLVSDIADVSLFAGYVGVTDMVTKCVQRQQQDTAHVTLFKTNPETYLIELMRMDSAVTSVTELLRDDEMVTLEGRNFTLKKGTPVQIVIATSNRDPLHFERPDTFDPTRSDLGDTLSWNGRVRDAESRNLEAAPRHCPGYCLSLKVGAAVCARLMGSFEELLQQGKVGGGVTCQNFPRADGVLSEPPLWHPPEDGPTHPDTA